MLLATHPLHVMPSLAGGAVSPPATLPMSGPEEKSLFAQVFYIATRDGAQI
jgi:hypothetical protein